MSEPKRRRRQVIEPLPEENVEEQFSQEDHTVSQHESIRLESCKAEQAPVHQDFQPKKSARAKKSKRGLIFMVPVVVLLMIVCTAGAVLYNSASFTYQRAQNALSKGRYPEAIRLFEGLGGYEDSTNLTVYCKALQLAEEGDYESAISALNGLGDYKDCLLRIPYYYGKGYEQNGQKPENEWMNFEFLEAAVSSYETNPLYLDSSARIESLNNQIQQIKSGLYNSAVDDAERGEYAQADSIFTRLGSYSDCKKRILYYDIREAEDALPEQDQDAALAIRDRYLETPDYLDCNERAQQLQERVDGIVSRRYAHVEELLKENKVKEAEDALDGFGTYGNGRTKEYYYQVAEAFLTARSYDEASAAFAKAGSYKYAASRVLEPYYVQAEALLAEEKYDEASAAFAKAGSYKYAASRVLEPYYVQAEALLAEEKYDDASAAFVKAGSYKDAADRVFEPYYVQAEALLAGGKKDEASAAFDKAGSYKDAAERACELYYEQAEMLLAAGQDQQASEAFARAGSYKDALKQSYAIRYRGAEGSLAPGDVHTVGLKRDGTVIAVGWNLFDKCDVSGWRDIVAVAAGYDHTVGLKRDGTVVAVGCNWDDRCNVSDWRDIVAVAAGSSHTVGLKRDGTVVAVGSNKEYKQNYAGQCDVSGWRDIVAVAAGKFHTVGLKRDGTVVAVGYNEYSQCDVIGWTGMGGGLTLE